MASTVCRYYQQSGKCFYGAECKFSHDGPPASGGGGASSDSGSTLTVPSSLLAPSPSSSPALNAPAPSPKSNLAAGAKEWTPAGSGSAAAAATTVAASATTPVRAAAATRLNPNKTPFKPAEYSAAEFIPSGSSSSLPAPWNPSEIAEFVPTGGGGGGGEDALDGVQEGEYAEEAYETEVSPSQIAPAPAQPISYMTLSEFASSCAPVSGTRPVPVGIPSPTQANDIFMTEQLRVRLTHWAHLTTARLQPEEPAFATLPVTLDHERYHSLMPLPPDVPTKALEAAYAKTAGGSVSYKATSAADGRCYVIKRLHACRLSEDKARALLQPWMDLATRYGTGATAAHPTILAPRAAFLTKDFGPENAAPTATPANAAAANTCVVYDYLPTAAALQPGSTNLPLELVWSYTIQLLTAISAIHDAGLIAGEMLRVGRLLLTSDQRLHLAGAGLTECLNGTPQPQESGSALTKAQLQDFRSCGCLLLGWLGFAEVAPVPGSPAKEFVAAWNGVKAQVQQAFPGEVTELVTMLCSAADVNAGQVMIKLAPRLAQAYTQQLVHSDTVESELAKETQNGRLFRLLVKLGFVTDRGDGMAGNWSETGDRYLLSLYRDLVFHSVHSVDVPNLDWGHVLHQLNKLDAGSNEKLLLSSRNGESMLLVRYSELKRCIEESYAELLRKQHEGLGGSRQVAQQQQQQQQRFQGMPQRASKPSIMKAI